MLFMQHAPRSLASQGWPAPLVPVRLLDLKTGKAEEWGPWVEGAPSVALAPDEKRLYVADYHAGKLHAVDLDSGKVVDTWTGHETDNLARSVVLHPTRPKAYLSHIRSKVQMVDGRGSVFPQLSVCDLGPAKSADEKRRKSFGMDTYNGVYVVTNSWEAALSPDGKRLYTIYAGTNDMNVSAVIDDDYQEI